MHQLLTFASHTRQYFYPGTTVVTLRDPNVKCIELQILIRIRTALTMLQFTTEYFIKKSTDL
jgi:hypothetical protein